MWTQLFLVLGSSLLTATVFFLLFLVLWRPLFNWYFDRFVRRLFTDQYVENLLEGFNAVRRHGVQHTIENELRCAEGRALLKPIGTHRHYPHFDGLLLTPAQLERQTRQEQEKADISITLGRNCKRPLHLKMPILSSAMGYGVALSKEVLLAIAKGTAMAGTACNTGQGPYVPEVRSLAHKLIVQLHGAPWKPTEEQLAQADMIEIRYGQGATGGLGTVLEHSHLTPEILADLGASNMPDSQLYIPAGIPGIHNVRGLKQLVKHLRSISGGVPIALKLAATHHLEREMMLAIEAGVDVIVLDGAQGGTHDSPAILVDDFGLPTLAALVRAVRFLEEQKRTDIDIIISGGLRTPGDMLKAMALGASAVYLGTPILFAAVHDQIVGAIPFEPPTELSFADGSLTHLFDAERGASSIANFLSSCAEEIEIGIRALGKTSLAEVNRKDLVAWQKEVAEITSLPYIADPAPPASPVRRRLKRF